MIRQLGILLAAAALPVTAAAQNATEYVCTAGDLVRRIQILSEPGVPVPCEVHYIKETEAPGERQVLWQAQNEAGYCEARAAELVDKLTASGFSCSSDDTAPRDDEAPQDDTDVLAPGDASRDAD